MAYELIVSNDAEADISDITWYITYNLKNQKAASGFLDEVEKAYRNVSQHPHLYSFCSDDRLREKEYRKIILKNFIMVYRVLDDEKSVFVLRVFYGRMDYVSLL